MRTVFYIFALAGLTATVWGQSNKPKLEKIPLPPGPLINRTPDFSQWLITYSNTSQAAPVTLPGADSTAALPKPRTLLVTKTKTTILEKLTDESGRTVETWKKTGGVATVKGADGKWIVSLGGGGDPLYSADYSKSDFAGLDWVSPAGYVGVKPVKGRKCLVFTGRVQSLSRREMEVMKEMIGRQIVAEMLAHVDTSAAEAHPGTQVQLNKAKTKPFDPNDYMVDAELTVDMETRLPVIFTYGSSQRTYEFRGAPQAELTFPAEAEKEASSYVQYLNKLSTHPAAP